MTALSIESTPDQTIAHVSYLAKRQDISTPALVYSKAKLWSKAKFVNDVVSHSGGSLLYSVKALSNIRLIEEVAEYVNGFSVCSFFEAKLVRESIDGCKPLHFTSPLIVHEQLIEIFTSSDYVSCNSLSQLEQIRSAFENASNVGLRINPGVSFVADGRYNPCRPYSKLGVSLDEFTSTFRPGTRICDEISGIHFHNNCESSDLGQLITTVERVVSECTDILGKLQWVNVGGGYLFDRSNSIREFGRAIEVLKDKYSLNVFVEPGTAFVREAGYLVSEIVDDFSRDGKRILILDTSVNHMPEVLEYQYEPDVLGTGDDGDYHCVLAGCSCLSGDVFGEYAFDSPLTIGDRVVFSNVGDYTTSKWHYFNGINLPSIYLLDEDNELVLVKDFTYENFAERNGAVSNVAI